MHDRVKNNLALMSGLIQLEHDFNDSKNSAYLKNTISRIHSMAMVHEKLYHTETFSSIRMDEYVKELSESIKKHSDFNTDNYQLQILTEPVTLSIKKAIPTGLLLNELLVNIFKYAFVERNNGKAEINLSQEGTEVSLRVSDNGVGLPENFNLDNPTTLGMRLVTILCKQLNASLNFDTKKGTTFVIRFTNHDKVNKSNKTA